MVPPSLLTASGERNGNPLQCSCLENPKDGQAWWAAAYGVAQSRTRLKWLSSSSRHHHHFLLFFLIVACSSESQHFQRCIIIRKYYEQFSGSKNLEEMDIFEKHTRDLSCSVLLNITELSTLKLHITKSGWILWCVNYTSIKLFFKICKRNYKTGQNLNRLVIMCVYISCSVISNSLQPHGL